MAIFTLSPSGISVWHSQCVAKMVTDLNNTALHQVCLKNLKSTKSACCYHCLGEEAEDVLESTGISDEHRKEYSQVLSKFDAFFHVKKNVIIERTKFNRRFQLPEEPADQFIAS